MVGRELFAVDIPTWHPRQPVDSCLKISGVECRNLHSMAIWLLGSQSTASRIELQYACGKSSHFWSIPVLHKSTASVQFVADLYLLLVPSCCRPKLVLSTTRLLKGVDIVVRLSKLYKSMLLLLSKTRIARNTFSNDCLLLRMAHREYICNY